MFLITAVPVASSALPGSDTNKHTCCTAAVVVGDRGTTGLLVTRIIFLNTPGRRFYATIKLNKNKIKQPSLGLILYLIFFGGVYQDFVNQLR